MIDLTKKPANKHQMLLDEIHEISTSLENLRLRTCYWYESCDNCPAHTGVEGFTCLLARMEVEAEDIIYNCENQEN